MIEFAKGCTEPNTPWSAVAGIGFAVLIGLIAWAVWKVVDR